MPAPLTYGQLQARKAANLLLVGAFVAEWCVLGTPDARVSGIALYALFKAWCAGRGVRLIERWRFDEIVIDTVAPLRWNDHDGEWLGIGLRAP